MRRELPKIGDRGDCPPAESRTPAAPIRRGAYIRFKKILVTGGAGFIGSEFVRLLVKQGLSPSRLRGLSPKGTDPEVSLRGTVPEIIVVDNLTYAADLKRLEEVKDRFKFYRCNICDKSRMEAIFKKEKPDVVVNFAASTHVDRSIQNATPFIDTNIKGTQILLDVSRTYGVKRLIHLSSDEVYGEIKKGKFSEDSPLQPNSPYAASKAAADLLIKAYMRTYNFPAIIVRLCNNYGPWQYPEKLIPVAIASVLKGGRVPVYAKGRNIREWLYVDDCARGIMQIMRKGKVGEIYNLGSGIESKNINTVKLLLKNLGVGQDRFDFVKDRPGHDIRYSLDSAKAKKEIGWKPKVKFEEGIRLTVNWYLRHKNWLLSKE